MPRRRWVRLAALVAGLTVILAGCGNPRVIGNMPGPVREVLNRGTPSGLTIAVAMLKVTGNQGTIGRGKLPGYYTYGPDQEGDGYYVRFDIPVDQSGIEDRLGYRPDVTSSDTLPGQVYLEMPPLANEAYQRLYFDPSTGLANFDFKLLPDGAVVDESWDAVLVNS